MPSSRAMLSLALALALLSGCKSDPNTPEHWEKKLSDAKRGDAKVQVVEALRSSGHLQASFLPMLHQQLATQKRPDVKAALARAVGDLKNPSSLEPLQAALDPQATDTDTALANKELVAALGRLGDPKAAPALTGMLKAKDSYTRIEAIQALGLLRAPEAVEPLIQLASNEDTEPFLNKKAIEALGRIGDARAVPVLMRMLTKERQGISFYVESSYALYQVGSPATEAVIAAMENRDAALAKWAQDNGVNSASYAMKGAQILGDLRDPRGEAVLLKQLSFTNEDPRIQALVRMQAAQALGRMRAKAAVRPISALLTEQDPTVRASYVRALVLLGDHEAVPALQKAAEKGDWYAREVAMRGAALLSEANDQPSFMKWAQTEPAVTAKECQDSGGEGCENPDALGMKRAEVILRYAKVPEAVKACGVDDGCWTRKLADKEARVVERAALQLGRSRNPQHAPALAERLSEKDLDARFTVIQSLDWLVSDSKEAATKAREALPKIQAQLADEKGNSTFINVNEDLRRLIFRLEKA